MAFTVRYNEERNCITVVVEGELDLTLLQNMAAEVGKMVKQKGCSCILNDLRNARPAKRALDIYNMPESARRAGVTQGFKRALVVGDRGPDFYFLETVFINQGHQVKMFVDIEDAKEWLFGK
jgi:hypothetical protein